MKPARLIVLCEDKQQQVFVRRFMKPRTNHPIRVISAPAAAVQASSLSENGIPRN